MSSVRNIGLIGYNTFKHITQGKVLINTLFITLALFIATFVATKFTYGSPQKVALDIGLGFLSVSCLIIALSLGVGLISDEIESRTLYVILARAVRRYEFILGKILGLAMVLLVNLVILCTATTITYKILGGKMNGLIVWCMGFICLESLMLLFVTVLFSLITSKVFTVLLSITIWCLGYIASSTLESPLVMAIPYLKDALEVYTFIFPAFHKFNLKDYVLYEQLLPLSYLLKTVLYFGMYSAGLIIASSMIFNKKNLD